MIQEDPAATVEADARGNVTKEAIPSTDGDGRFRTSHTLRYTCGSWLAARGVHPRTIQTIMRHGDGNLMTSRYSHALRNQTAAVVARLSSPPVCGPQSQKATGTGGKRIDLAELGAPGFTNMHQSTPGTPADGVEPSIPKPTVGFEPTTPGLQNQNRKTINPLPAKHLQRTA